MEPKKEEQVPSNASSEEDILQPQLADDKVTQVTQEQADEEIKQEADEIRPI